MRLVFLHRQVVTIANQVAANSLWKAGRPYLCIPMQKNGMVYHIIPFRTAKRKPYEALQNTVIFPLKRRMGTNADGEYPFLDLSKSFLVRENHFYDIPEDFYIDGYMRVDESIGKITGMSRKYITKMNAGKLEGVRQRYCVDYVAILRELDRQLPNPNKAKAIPKRMTKKQLAQHREILDTYRDVVVDPVEERLEPAETAKVSSTVTIRPVEAVVPLKPISSSEREQTYAEIDKEISNALAEQGFSDQMAETVQSVALAPFKPDPVKPSKSAQKRAHVYGTTMADIRAAENEIAFWDKWLEGTDWSLDLKRKERMDVYNDVDISEYLPENNPADLQKAMRDEIYDEIKGDETLVNDEVGASSKKKK